MDFTLTEFTPLSATVGGALIGLSSGLLLLMLGKIAGVSGIAAGAFSSDFNKAGWRLAFIAGLIFSAIVYRWFSGAPLDVDIQMSLPWMIVGGFLVGLGTRMGSGCTAGHGISGLARLSKRSFIATLIFFLTAMVTTTAVRGLV